ncbi:MAG: hypothetical protein AAF693_03210 [Bacteroidota bacterium]
MKKISYLLSVVILAGVLAMTGCGDDDSSGPTITEQQLSALVGTWAPTNGDASVTLGGSGNDAPGDWSNFSITFTNSQTASVSNVPDEVIGMFAINSFTFSNESVTNIGLTFGADAATVQVNSETNIILSFTLEDGGSLGARTSSVQGNWSFDLTKQ